MKVRVSEAASGEPMAWGAVFVVEEGRVGMECVDVPVGAGEGRGFNVGFELDAAGLRRLDRSEEREGSRDGVDAGAGAVAGAGEP
jgi:hypothetical protein